MKKLLIGLTLLTSMSSFATSPQAGDTLELSIDSKRIESGLKTGDFSCKGTCASVSVDWSAVGEAITGKNKRARRASERQSLRIQLNEYMDRADSLNEKIERGELSQEEASIHSDILEITKKSILLGAQVFLSEREVNSIADEVLK